MSSLIFIGIGFFVIVLVVYYKYFVHVRYYVTPHNTNTARKLVMLGLKRKFRKDPKDDDHEVYRVTKKMMKELSSDPQMSLACWKRIGTGCVVSLKSP
ncbi:MAG: hypothetical protein WCO30_00695 [bacterium]